MQRKQKLKRIHPLPPINSSRAKIPKGLPLGPRLMYRMKINGDEGVPEMQKNSET